MHFGEIRWYLHIVHSNETKLVSIFRKLPADLFLATTLIDKHILATLSYELKVTVIDSNLVNII